MAGYPKKEKMIGCKAKQPHPGMPLDKSKIAELIKIHTGNISRVADAMGTTRGTIRAHCDRDPELKQCLIDARERWIDDIELSVLSRAHETTDTGLQCFVLKTQARHRGWDQSEGKEAAADIAKAAFDFILNKSKNPAESL